MGREVGNDIKALLITEDTLEDWIGKVEGVSAELLRHVHSVNRTEVAREFGKPILVKVDHNELGRSESTDSTNVAGTNGTCSTNDAY